MAEPYKLFSLWSLMERFHAQFYLMLSAGIQDLRAVRSARANSEVAAEDAASFLRILGDYERECEAMGLKCSLRSLRRLTEMLENGESPTPWADVIDSADEFMGRLKDEMSETFFFSLSPQERHYYEQPLDGWERIVPRFRDTRNDVEGASKCLALARHTASVFHLMRVMEVGVRALGVSLNDPSMDPRANPNWGAILKRCDEELQKPPARRTPEWQSDELFFSTAAANLRAVKDAWRNTTMHVDQSYSEEQAREIYAAVRGFMRHLATKLP